MPIRPDGSPMNASTRLLPEHQQLLERLIGLTSREEQQWLLDQYPQAREAEFVEALCIEATKLVRVDVRRAKLAAELAAELADELDVPAVRGRSRRALANVFQTRHDYQAAVRLYEEALAIYTEFGPELEVGITRSSALLPLTCVGQHDRSLEWAKEARRIFEAENDALRLGRLDLNLGTIVYRQERFEEARALMERAYDRLLEVGEPPDVAHCLRNLATVHIGLKNFREAEDVYARARRYCQQEDLPVLLGEVDYNIAYLYYLRGEYRTAIELYRETRERCEATGEFYHQALCDLDEGEIYLELNLIEETVRSTDAAYRRFEQLGMRYEAGKALTHLAIARIRQGKTILGLDLFGQAREIFVDERNHIWLALIDFYKALALAREGRRFEAEGLVDSAHPIFVANGLEPKAAATEALAARLRLEAGDVAAARQLCHRALERLAGLDLPALEHQVLFISGCIEERAGNREAALAAYEASHHSLARSRSTAHTEELKIPLLSSNLQVYESLVALGAGGPGASDPDSVFKYMEIAKARNMIDLLAFRGLALPTRKAHSTQVERVRRLREELNWYYRRIDIREVAHGPSGEELSELRRLTRRTEDALADSLREVEATDPEFAALRTASAGGATEVRDILPAGSTLVEFYTARDTIYACTLTAEDLDVTAVSLGTRVREIQQRYNDQLLKFRLGDAHIARFAGSILQTSQDVLHELYLELLEPLESRLGGGSLIVVPHGFLHWLPFSALFDGEVYMADRFAISYAPTATVLHSCCTRPPVAGRGSVLIAVTEEALAETERLSPELPEARVCAGSEASAATLRGLARGARILHLATTAEFRRDNPMFSSIQLADGGMTFFDLYSLDLSAELTVLSGCGGSVEAPSDGDEQLGLARGFLYAGSRSVLLPLWDSPVRARIDLLASFYRLLDSSSSRGEALNRAMLEVRERHPHPYYWASFALIGDPS